MYSLLAFIFHTSFLFRGVLLFVFGAVIGSFLNVVIYRLPLILKRQWHKEAQQILGIEQPLVTAPGKLAYQDMQRFNLCYPPSHCQSCGHHVPFWVNIPLVGYFLANGRCLHCRNKIALMYLLVECSSAVLFVAVGFITNLPWLLFAYLVFISIVICLIVIDYQEMLLPDELTLSLLWLGLLFNLNGMVCGRLQDAVIGAVLGYVFLWLIYWLVRLVTRKDGMGYGDFKFFAAILAWFGYQWFVLLLMVAPLLGIIYYGVGRMRNKLAMHSEIPFGTFLGISAICMVFASRYYAVIPFIVNF